MSHDRSLLLSSVIGSDPLYFNQAQYIRHGLHGCVATASVSILLHGGDEIGFGLPGQARFIELVTETSRAMTQHTLILNQQPRLFRDINSIRFFCLLHCIEGGKIRYLLVCKFLYRAEHSLMFSLVVTVPDCGLNEIAKVLCRE